MNGGGEDRNRPPLRGIGAPLAVNDRVLSDRRQPHLDGLGVQAGFPAGRSK
jgi:hypothetical protein